MFEVWRTRLDPAEGSEMRKARPVVILSPDVMNDRLHIVLIAPQNTSAFKPVASRTRCAMPESVFKGKWPQLLWMAGRWAE